MRERRRAKVDEHIVQGRYRMAGYLGPWSSSFTLAWLASHRARLRILALGGKRLSLFVVWDTKGSENACRNDEDIEAIRVLVGPKPATGETP